MDIHSITVSKEDVERELAIARPGIPAGGAGNACDAYRQVRPGLEIALALLSVWYPPGAAALATIKVILDKACDQAK
jgi:hypothetical protein